MLKELLKALAAKATELEGFQSKALADDATAEDHAAVSKCLDEVLALEAKVKTQEALERVQARAAQPVGDDTRTSRTAPVARALAGDDVAAKFGLLLKGLFRAKKIYGNTALDNIERSLNDLGIGSIVDIMGGQKALTTLTGPSGGFAVPEDFAEELIPLLYAQSGFMRGNPRRIPMPHGNWSQAGGATGAVASYRGEGDDIAVTSPTFRDISMRAHLLSAIVPATNQFLDYSVSQATQFVRNDLAQAMSLRADRAFFLGTGTVNEPLGILRLPGTIQISAPSGRTPNVGVVEGVAYQGLAISAEYPALAGGLAWVMTSRTHLYLSGMRGSDDKPIYTTLTRANGGGGTWMGIPVIVVGTIPNTGGTGTNESKIALISFDQILVGESKGLEIDMSSEAAWRDADGDLQSAFSTDSTLFRARMEHDVASRYVEAVVVINGVQWGAAA